MQHCICNDTFCFVFPLEILHYSKVRKGGFEMTEKRENQYRQLGLTIAYYRKMRGLTQLQLAECVELSRTHVSNLEAPNMPTSISLDKLFDIAEALDIPVSRLFEFRES